MGDSCKKGAVWLSLAQPQLTLSRAVCFPVASGAAVELGVQGLPAPLPSLPDGAPAGWFAPLPHVIEEGHGRSPALVTLLMSEQTGAVNN